MSSESTPPQWQDEDLEHLEYVRKLAAKRAARAELQRIFDEEIREREVERELEQAQSAAAQS